MSGVNFKKVVSGEIEEVGARVTDALKKQGFGVLTRIDFDVKIREKLGKEIPPVIILGACNPQLAYEAYLENSDVTSLLPCNAVLRQLSPGKISIELARPTLMMEMLKDQKLIALAKGADQKILYALESI